MSCNLNIYHSYLVDYQNHYFSTGYVGRWVSGISACLAKKIISHRQRFGAFINRQMLLDVKGLGPKTFKQCAGFVRINPTSGAEDTNSDEVIVISTR